ncbi:MAG: cbb3-type cytochrome oxidase assembly protein CcoS [bacterium]
MYVLSWSILVVLSIGVSLAAFFWALRNGQFSEQDRARYLPLAGEPPRAEPPGKPKGLKAELWALGVVVCIGLAGFAAAVVLATLRAKG